MSDVRRRWQLVRGGSPSSRRFAARSRQWRMRILLPYLVLVVVLAAAGGIGWVVYGTTVFVAEQVVVRGARTVPVAEVLQAAAVPTDVPLAQLDTGAVAVKVGTLPPVAAVRVTRAWPSTVTITVTERVAVAVLRLDGAVSLVDGSGVAFRTVEHRPAELPEISVEKPSQHDPATRAALAVAAALPPDLRAKLARISAATSEQVTLELDNGRIVFWGGAEDNDRKATVTMAILERPGKRIDVSAPDFVTVR